MVPISDIRVAHACEAISSFVTLFENIFFSNVARTVERLGRYWCRDPDKRAERTRMEQCLDKEPERCRSR
jgi:hypothetical protein